MDRYNVDVLIIGAGATGTAVARELSKLKQTVLVELKSGATIELPVGEVTIEAEQPHKQQKNKG